MLRTVRLALGFVALWKAVDLALRLPGRMPAVAAIAVLAVWAGGATLLVLDRWTHVAGAALVVAGSVSILVGDLYNHHLYLFVVVGAIVALFDTPEQAVLMRWQLTIVYGFAVLAKVNGTFLSGAVVRAALDRSTLFAGDTFGDLGAVLLAGTTVLIELALPIALWWGPRSRRVALAAGLVFHVSVVLGTAYDLESFVQLVSFGAVMLSLYLAFFVDEPAPAARTGSSEGRRASTLRAVQA